MSRLRWSLLLPALLATVSARPAAAQGVIVNLHTRQAATGRTTFLDEAGDRRAEALSRNDVAAVAAIDEDVKNVTTGRNYARLTRLTDEEAGAIWASPRATLLPAARVSPGTDRTALYTELGQAVSGGWRFVLGTALAVETQTEEDEEPAAQQEGEAEEPDPATGFRRFVSGGGNLSFAAMRPLALKSVGYSDHVIVAVPRVWANIPTLSDADAVQDFGGELAAEYSYLRYARQKPALPAVPAPPPAPGAVPAPKVEPEVPFLALQVRTGVVMGTNSFYRTIGLADERMFVYTVPTLNLQFSNGVKVGVSYFYALGDFSQHENLRFHVTLSPPKAGEP